MGQIESAKSFAHAWRCWKYLGRFRSNYEGKYAKLSYKVYSIVVLVFLEFLFPIHLLLPVFNNSTQEEYMRTFSICLTCASTSLKFVLLTTKLDKVLEVERLLGQLDARVTHVEDRKYWRKVRKEVAYTMGLFRMFFIPIPILAWLNVIFQNDRSLLYPGWVPFNVQSNGATFYFTLVYQFVGLGTYVWQNYSGDSFTAVVLCVLSGQIKLLGMRASRIGYEQKSQEANELELRECILDQRNIYKLIKTIREIISMPMLIQFGVTAFNICMNAIGMFFYAHSFYDKLYFFCCLMAMWQEVFPICYFGTKFQLTLGELHRDMFACNWIYQSRRFKKDMMLFIERSLQQDNFCAGGLVRISLETFFATVKATYSLITLVLNFSD